MIVERTLLAVEEPTETYDDPKPFCITREQYYQLGDLGWFMGRKVELLDGIVWDQYPGNDREPAPYAWSREEFYQMLDLDWFQGIKAELIGGEIMVQSPQKYPHYASLDKTGGELKIAFGPGHWVRTQSPMGIQSEPEPDVSVVPGKVSDYSDHPTTALLLVEVSETTLRYDRTVKGSLYASAGIADYWIVNLIARQLEVYRNPIPDNTQRFGWRYSHQIILSASDSFSPLAAPLSSIKVADLLP